MVLGNTGNPAAVPALAVALRGHDAPLVRQHAAWALGQLRDVGGAGARVALEAARRDPDAGVRTETEAALDT